MKFYTGILLFIVVAVGNCQLQTKIGDNGWGTQDSKIFYALIKDCENCFISITIEEGSGHVVGNQGKAYITNTKSAANFIKRTENLVFVPDLSLGVPQTFIPWYNCGLSIISVSSGVPYENLLELNQIAKSNNCEDMNVIDDFEYLINVTSGATNYSLVPVKNLLILFFVLVI